MNQQKVVFKIFISLRGLWDLKVVSYYKLQQNIITIYGSFFTNYDNVLLQIMAALLQIMTVSYYRLW